MTGSWEPRRLGTLLKLTSGQSPSGFIFGTSGTPYYKVEQLGRSRKYLGRSSTPYFSTSVPQVPAGSVLIAKRGAAIALNRVRLLAEPSFMDTNIMALTPSAELDPEFLYYWLSYRGLWDVADVTSVPQINNKHILPLEIPLASLDEQQRIVAVLRDFDDWIDALERQIAKKEATKRGMAQRLLTGRTRMPGFAGARSESTVSDLGVLLRGRGIKRDDVRSRGVACVRYGEIYTSFDNYTSQAVSYVTPQVAATALALRRGDLLFAASGETHREIGKCVAYVGEEPAVAGGDTIVLRARGVHPVYLAMALNSPAAVNQKSRLGQGDAVVHISRAALGSIRVQLPPVDEQSAIAKVFIDADTELQALRRRLMKAMGIQNGVVRQLLSGRVRLPELEAVA